MLAHGGAEADVNIGSHKVFAHPKNRDAEILVAMRAQTRVAKVNDAGYSHTAASKDAVAFEDNPKTRAIAKVAETVSAKSEYYAKYNAAEVGYGSVGASHFNHGIEQLKQGVRCNIESISENGRMSRVKLEQRFDGFKKACQVGLKWRCVIFWEIEEMFPALPLLFQSALTTTGQIQEGDSRLSDET